MSSCLGLSPQFALSSDPEIIRYTAWGTAWYKNETSMVATKFYIGLLHFVVTTCPDAEGDDSWDFECETENMISWESIDKDHSLYGFRWEAVRACKEQAEGNQVRTPDSSEKHET